LDILTFVVALLQALIWPAVVLTIALIFRGPLSGLIHSLTKLKYKGLELEFEKEVLELAQKAGRTLLEPQAGRKGVGKTDLEKRQWTLAETNPRAAVLEAWTNLEAAGVMELAKRGVHLTYADRGPLALGERLHSVGLLSKELEDVYHELRFLRNRVAHVPEFEPITESVKEYIALTVGLIHHLQTSTGAARPPD
jgi:hypothetical protein